MKLILVIVTTSHVKIWANGIYEQYSVSLPVIGETILIAAQKGAQATRGTGNEAHSHTNTVFDCSASEQITALGLNTTHTQHK